MITKLELEAYINRLPRKHDEFPSEVNLWKLYLLFSRKFLI